MVKVCSLDVHLDYKVRLLAVHLVVHLVDTVCHIAIDKVYLLAMHLLHILCYQGPLTSLDATI